MAVYFQGEMVSDDTFTDYESDYSPVMMDSDNNNLIDDDEVPYPYVEEWLEIKRDMMAKDPVYREQEEAKERSAKERRAKKARRKDRDCRRALLQARIRQADELATIQPMYQDSHIKPDEQPAQQRADGSDTMSEKSTKYSDDGTEEIIRTAFVDDLEPRSASKSTSASQKPPSPPSKSTSSQAAPKSSKGAPAPLNWPQPRSHDGHLPNPELRAARITQYERLIAEAHQVLGGVAQQQMPGTFHDGMADSAGSGSQANLAFSGSSDARCPVTPPPSSPSSPSTVRTSSSSPNMQVPLSMSTCPVTPVRNKTKQRIVSPSSAPYLPTKTSAMMSPPPPPTKSLLGSHSPTKKSSVVSPPVSPSRSRVPLLCNPPVVRSDILAKDHASPPSGDDRFIYYLPHPTADGPLRTDIPPHVSRDPGLEKQTGVTLVTKGICPGIYFGEEWRAQVEPFRASHKACWRHHDSYESAQKAFNDAINRREVKALALPKERQWHVGDHIDTPTHFVVFVGPVPGVYDDWSIVSAMIAPCLDRIKVGSYMSKAAADQAWHAATVLRQIRSI